MHTSHLDESYAQRAAFTSRNTASFAELFKNLRKQLVGKQACLSRAGLRCTDAAISHWERGNRLPRPKTLRNAVQVLIELGATPTDIEQLVSAWTREYEGKKLPPPTPSDVDREPADVFCVATPIVADVQSG